MKIRIALASATALALMMGGALADGNNSDLAQFGDSNEAQITQSSGAGNNAIVRQGTVIAGNDRKSYDASAVITQSGDDNRAGTGANPILQWGSQNSLTVLQQGDENLVNNLVQSAIPNHETVNGRNQAVVTQATNGNSVNRVSQIDARTGVDRSGVSNSLVIEQSVGDGNSIQAIFQSRYGGAAGDERNTTGVRQQGAGNSVGGAGLNIVVQVGHSNDIDILQDGSSNHVGYVAQAAQESTQFNTGSGWGSGLNNWAVVNQSGSDNIVQNVLQFGDDNTASILQSGDGNVAASSQKGVGNLTTIGQFSDDNQASVAMVGDDNGVVVVQGLGPDNIASVDITGNANGLGLSFTGAASGLGLTSGLINQSGTGNEASLTIAGNSNAFAFNQIGDGNTITGSQSGNFNQVAVSQSGGQNHAFTQQNGSGNIAAISQ